MSRRGSFRDLQPEDYAKHIERDRESFIRSIMIDPTMWAIARHLMKIHTDGYVTEGLRGIYDGSEGKHGQIIWWPARQASHHQGRLFLKKTIDNILEIEANVMENGTVVFFWSSLKEDTSEQFLSHPSLKENIDGMLAVRGKIVQIRQNRMHLCDDTPDPVKENVYERHREWTNINDLVDPWKRRRKDTMPDGSPTPLASSQRPFRIYMQMVMAYLYYDPVPAVSVTEDRQIRFEWRKTGSVAEMLFRDEGIFIRMNDDGNILTTEIDKLRRRSEIPWPISTRLLSFDSVSTS